MSAIGRTTPALVGAITLTAALILGPTPWALADQTITTQPYYAASGIKALHAQGLDGSGIKIAVIDGPVDTSVPELLGVNVITKSFCDLKYAPSGIAHATNIAAILASPDYGWAPKATILNYTHPVDQDVPAGMTMSDYVNGCPMDSVDPGFLINQALNDGANVISMSFGMGTGMAESSVIGNALTRAMNLQVPVIASAGNESTTIDWSGLAGGSTILSVGAVDGTGKKAAYSNYGTGMSLMAYGGPPLTYRNPDSKGHLTVITKGDTGGTSMAAPMVAGALALAYRNGLTQPATSWNGYYSTPPTVPQTTKPPGPLRWATAPSTRNCWLTPTHPVTAPRCQT